MFERLNLDKVLAFTKLTLVFTGIWPPEGHFSSREIHLLDLTWYFCLFSSTTLLIFLIAAICIFKNDPVVISKSVCLACACSQNILKGLICRKHRQRLKYLVYHVRLFLFRAGPSELKIVQCYIKNSASIHLFVTCCCFGAAFIVLCGPLLIPDSNLPSDAVYPFSVESGPLWLLAYVHHGFAAFQVSSSMCIDVFGALLMWYAGMRFELLQAKFEGIQCDRDLLVCIQEHQELLSYGHELCQLFRLIVISTTISITPAIAFSGVYVFSPQPLFVKLQFIVVAIAAGIMLYVTSVPADNLLVKSRDISNAASNSLMIEQAPNMRRNWVMVVQRAQKPVKLKVAVFMSELSLQYFSMVLSKTFSYFTALHVLMMRE